MTTFSIRIINIASLLLLCCCSSSHSMLAVLDMFNRTLMEFGDRQADFGPLISSHGVWGHIAFTEPENGCSQVKPPPYAIDNSSIWIAVVVRYPCQFDQKVLNAQKAGYGAAIVYNNGSDDLVTMHGSRRGISIPSVFVAGSTGSLLAQFNKRVNVTIVLWNSSSFTSLVYFIILGCIGGMGILLGICIVCVNWACQRARKHMSLLSKRKLKKLPVHKFKTGDPYETCAICLEEYIDGDKLRLLPCGHAFHCRCIDPWLTEKRNTCPLCKDVVGRRHGNTAAAVDETQPLLQAQDDSDNTGGVTNAGFETTADVHIVPAHAVHRSYGAVSDSPIPSAAVVTEIVADDSEHEHDESNIVAAYDRPQAGDTSSQHSNNELIV